MESYIKDNKQRSLFSKLMLIVFIIAMLGSAVALLLSYMSPFMDPYNSWLIAFCGLATPLLMLVNLIFLLILGIKLSKWAIIPLVALLVGVGYIGDFLQVNFTTKYPSDKRYNGTELKILTYNVHGFRLTKDPMGDNMKAELRFIVEQNPDIVAFQEVNLIKKEHHAILSSFMNRWKYHLYSLFENEYNQFGLMIFSKYPLINGTSIKFKGHENSAMYADAIIGEDTIRIFNNHLQSTQFNGLNKKLLKQEQLEDAARMVGAKLRLNYKARTMQADTIASLVAQSPHPTIVVGDFNDTPMSYTYNLIKGNLKDSFREAGEGYGYSYIPLYKLFRIDYVLYTEGKFEALSYHSPLEPYSDHKPVIVRLGIPKNK